MRGKVFGVNKNGRLYSPSYYGNSPIFSIRIIHLDHMYYVWDGKACLWAVKGE